MTAERLRLLSAILLVWCTAFGLTAFFTPIVRRIAVRFGWIAKPVEDRWGRRATDYEGCYKAFSRAVIQQTPLESNGFEFDNELVCKLLRRRRRIVEVPIHYEPRVYGEGKKIRWQHGIRMVWAVLKWRVMPF